MSSLQLSPRALIGAALAVLFLAAPAGAIGLADLPCPFCDPAENEAAVTVGDLVDQVLWSLIGKGISFLLVASVALVSLPWVIAGGAILATHVPRLLRS